MALKQPTWRARMFISGLNWNKPHERGGRWFHCFFLRRWCFYRLALLSSCFGTLFCYIILSLQPEVSHMPTRMISFTNGQGDEFRILNQNAAKLKGKIGLIDNIPSFMTYNFNRSAQKIHDTQWQLALKENRRNELRKAYKMDKRISAQGKLAALAEQLILPKASRQTKDDKMKRIKISDEKPRYPNRRKTSSSRYITNVVGDATECHAWCHTGRRMKPPYFLTAVLLVRIYDKDLAQLSSREMLQWLMYLRYAGVEHVYVYDAYVFANESQRDALSPLIDEEYVTYIDWHHRAFPYSIDGTQIAAYQDCIDRWGKNSTWRTAIDIDEYPFSPQDTKPGFMKRFISAFSARNYTVSEISMKNYLFLGKPLDDKTHPMLIDRFWRRTPYPSNELVKPVYQPKNVVSAGVHHNSMGTGNNREAPEQQLRLNHYWGARLQNWGEDTPKILGMTIPDRTMETIIEEIKQCDTCLGKDLLYRKKWN